MVVVPLDRVDTVIVALVGLEVLAGIGLRAKVDLALLSADEEEVRLILVEVEAHTTGKSIKESFFFVFNKTLVLIDDKSKLNDLFGLKLILHKGPVGDSTITGDGVEVQRLDSLVNIPTDLPNWISMLIGSHGGHVDWLVVSLKSNIKDHDSTIIKTNS